MDSPEIIVLDSSESTLDSIPEESISNPPSPTTIINTVNSFKNTTRKYSSKVDITQNDTDISYETSCSIFNPFSRNKQPKMNHQIKTNAHNAQTDHYKNDSSVHLSSTIPELVKEKLAGFEEKGTDSTPNGKSRPYSVLNSPPIYKFDKDTQRSSQVKKTLFSPKKMKIEIENGDETYSRDLNNSECSSSNNTEYEIDKIIDHVEITPERLMYKVKWVGCSEEESTWEPLENLTGCLDLVFSYKMKREATASSRQLQLKGIEKLKASLSTHTDKSLNIFIQKFRHRNGELIIPKYSEIDIQKYLVLFASRKKLIQSNRAELQYLQNMILTNIAHEKRRIQLENLRHYEIEINVSTGNKTAPIYVINNVDLECAPTNFSYTNFNIVTDSVEVNEEPVTWCDCPNNCQDSASCCAQINESVTAYDSNKRLVIERGMPIFECNKNCKCNNQCPNKVIQLGTKVELAIFRTYNGCGWGVQALENIPVGTFVTEYVGEILRNEHASKRSNQAYLFNLDFNDSTTYVIDACSFGNISHFINHSCNPNLAVYAAYIECLDPNLHRLPLFAIRDIKKGEQLTFSYLKPFKKRGKCAVVKQNITRCKCGSSKCFKKLEIC